MAGSSTTTASTSEIDLRDDPAASVLIVDDHTLLADSIARALRLEGLVANAAQPTSLAAVLDAASRLAPTVALVDLDLGHPDFTGLDLIGPLGDLGVAVVALTSWSDRLLVAASIESGAVGVISKSEPFASVVDAVQSAARGEITIDRTELDELRRELRQSRSDHAGRLAPFGRLTERERFVLCSLVDGRSADSIAVGSYVSISTVRSQIRSVLQKLEVNSQLEAVAAATRCGWAAGAEQPMIRYSSTLVL
jgi:DNA-binding NarL/FixJ family response regulator